MEDILASIKRIIAEDSEAAGARAPRLRREAMAAVSASPVVMPLRVPVVSEVAPEPADASHDEETAAPVEAEAPAQAAAPVAPREDVEEVTDILELTSPMSESAVPAPAPAEAAPVAPAGIGDGLLSSSSAAASRSAFAALSQLQVRSEQGQSNTLEGLVADLLKPMLREWLDRELPGIVERLVSAEVARLSGRA